MARTKASVGAKVAARKSSKARCSVAPPPTPSISGAIDRGSRSYSGGNSVCPRETPKWQKPITKFFISKEDYTSDSDDNEEAAVSSKPMQKRNIIWSDEENSPDKPKNRELDETIELEPLTGDNNHTIKEYYPSSAELKEDDALINGMGGEASPDVETTEENNNGDFKTRVKGKGLGKKSKDKENISGNLKRVREEECTSENDRKRNKVD